MQTGDKTRKLDKDQALGILVHLNSKELQDLLDNESKLDQMVEDNEQVMALRAEKQTIVASNKSLSEYNLSREPRLTQAKERLGAAYQENQELHQIVSGKKDRVEGNNAKLSVEEALAMLKTAAESLENDTETLSEQFLNGDLHIDAFLEMYIEKRCIAHTRKIKAEKMQEELKKKPPQGVNTQPVSQWPPPTSVPAYRPPAPAPMYGNAYGGGAPYGSPYPSHPMGMPSPQSYMPRR